MSQKQWDPDDFALKGLVDRLLSDSVKYVFAELFLPQESQCIILLLL